MTNNIKIQIYIIPDIIPLLIGNLTIPFYHYDNQYTVIFLVPLVCNALLFPPLA